MCETNFKELVLKRRSVRSYKSKPVEEEKLKRVLNAGRMAPSAGNRQAWKFIVVTDEDKRQKLVEICGGQSFVGEAPVVIAAVGLDPERTMTCEVPAYAVDVSIAVDHMTLAAAAEDLGTCWIGYFYQDQAKELLDVPDDAKIVTLLPLGYPDDEPKEKSRKSFDEVVAWEKFE